MPDDRIETVTEVPDEYRGRYVSPTCEHRQPNTICGQPTKYWYPAMGGGTMALCALHAEKHQPHCYPYTAPNAPAGPQEGA